MKEEWKKVKLGEISADIQTGPFGSQLHMSDYSEKGIPVVMPKDMINGKITEENIARVTDNHVKRLNRYIISSGNILYARRGDVGKCVYVSEKESGWLCGTGCLRININTAIANPKFVFFQLQKTETIGWVEKNAVGATMLNLNTSILANVPLHLPPLPTQQKIASVLSAYDDLIENNRRQIKLLEEAALKLYKEWFVKLNFPGHETTKIADGVPDGWKKGKLSDLGEFKRGKTITKDQTISGSVPVVAGGLEPAYYHNEFNTESPVITVSGSGANAGFTRMYNERVWASDCSFLDSSKCDCLFFIYCVLKSSTAIVDSLQKGAAQPHVYAKDINALEILIPNKDILEKFEKLTKPYFNKIKNCQLSIVNLQSARDKLLPKLMNGEIEV